MVAEVAAKQGKKISKKIDLLIWGVISVLLITGFIANYYFVQIPLALRLVGWLILVCIVLLLFVRTNHGERFWKFFKDARMEMRKVVWPNRQVTFQTTMMVIAVVIAFALIMWGLDAILMKLIGLLTG